MIIAVRWQCSTSSQHHRRTWLLRGVLPASTMSATMYESSDEDEDNNVHELVQSVFKSYGGKDLKTQHYLENQFQSGAATCLICIARVRRTQPIWSCEHCYCFLHLACIQRWANDSLAQKSLQHVHETGYYTNDGRYVPKPALFLNWYCPQCRTEYPKSSIPTRYTCFCGKEHNPEPHPWTIPHSCGEVCGKSLRPDCGHKCVLLCHPGACPPCPQMINKSCDCGQSPLKTIRCSAQSWQCGKPCQRVLSCGNHKCSGGCHKTCKSCPLRATKSCLCGQKKAERNCSEDKWRCDLNCNGKFDCGRHSCARGCHEGDCGPCTQPKTCPCGKEQSSGDCSTQVDSCGDTCLKKLDCGEHVCLDRCHKGSCSKCKETVEKSCFCGQQTKLVSCEKPFRCENKCKKLRNCKLHLCNRKCCDGQCPPCDKVCDKPLACTKHKCKSMCHMGPCYPCNLKASLKCRCRGTVIEVACGRAKKTKPPKCHLPCRRPSKCHHENLHNCHEGECPTCNKVCNLPNDTTKCEHPCQAKCHDSVLTRTVDKNWRPAGPWEVQPEVIEFLQFPHPKCEQKMEVACLGGHDTIQLPCWDSKPRTCGRSCDRRLKCGNHKCDKICHSVTDQRTTSEAIEFECMSCDRQCAFVRPTGCDHPCRKPCHRPPCSSCTAIIKTQCHCGLVQKMFKCSEAFKEGSTAEQNEKRKIKLMSCGNRCIKMYPCGHRCVENCHPGPCPNPDSCKKKVKVSCACKVRKAEVSCEKLRQGPFVLRCDDTCKLKLEERKLLEAEQEKEKMAAEEEQKRVEMEEFQRKYGTKKPKERKQRQNLVEEGRSWQQKALIAVGVLIPIVAGIIFYITRNRIE